MTRPKFPLRGTGGFNAGLLFVGMTRLTALILKVGIQTKAYSLRSYRVFLPIQICKQACICLHKKTRANAGLLFVGMTRFELATPRPPDVCATGLRYIPKFRCKCIGLCSFEKVIELASTKITQQKIYYMESLLGKVALVTGAGKGIGRAIALALAKEGVHVALLSRTEKDLTALADEIRLLGVKAAVTVADISNISEVNVAVQKAQTELGSIDILINNAGIGTFAKFLDLEPEEWENMIRVNLFGTYYATRAVLPAMINRKTGDIIIISSTAGKTGAAVTSAYSASKFAVFGMGESLMQEVRKHNIRVTTLAPSTVLTDLARSANLITGDADKVMHPEDFAELIIAHLKLNRRMLIKEAAIFSTNP